jgi:2'-5' RNA ligase
MSQVKTHLAAVVAVPPAPLWEPIQAIRQRHDRHLRDWMPHVTLLYPFRPRAEFDEVAAALTSLGVPPFDVSLATFRFFSHYEWSHTVWLDPQPAEPWKRLHEALLSRFPDCDDSSKYESGFTPHLSVGQSKSPELASELQRGWRPIAWRVNEIALIAREERRPFEMVRTIPL